MSEPEDDDGEVDVEFEPESYPDSLSTAEEAVFFYPDLGTFCEQHEAKAVMLTKGSVFLLPNDGGKWYAIEDHGKSQRTVRRVQ